MDFATVVTTLSAFATTVFVALQYWFNKEIHKQNSSKYTPKIYAVTPNPFPGGRSEESIYFFSFSCHCPTECTIEEVLLYKQKKFWFIFKTWEKFEINYCFGKPSYDLPGYRFSRNDNGRPYTTRGNTEIFIETKDKDDHFLSTSSLKFAIISNEGACESRLFPTDGNT